jgi:sulfite reductase (ferredoxin)
VTPNEERQRCSSGNDLGSSPKNVTHDVHHEARIPANGNVFERIKAQSGGLRGTIADELVNDSPGFSPDSVRLLKHFGIFQQDDRSRRRGTTADREDRDYHFMIRVRITGGVLSSDQFRSLLDVTDKWGDGVLRCTSRQGLQIHGIDKQQINVVLQQIDDLQLTTLGTAGDLNCNVMCVPAGTSGTAVHRELQAIALSIANHLMPDRRAYHELWQIHRTSPEHRGGQLGGEGSVYGESLLPHKFKVAIATPDDNCTDIFSQDVGLLADISAGHVVGCNVFIGGGMGTVLGVRSRFAALGQPFAYARIDHILPLVEAILRIYQLHGERGERGIARMKYLVHRWGVPKFQQHVEELLGHRIEPIRIADVVGCHDHLGWRQQNDGSWSLGLYVERGWVRDSSSCQLKAFVQRLLQVLTSGNVQLTPQQNMIFTGITPPQRHRVDSLLAEYGIRPVELSRNVRGAAMACPGLPYCPSAITHSEPLLTDIITALEDALARHSLSDQKLSVRVTGCPLGCTRPYLADIAVVGRTVAPESGMEKYAIFLGGDSCGRRLNTLYQDFVGVDRVVAIIRELIEKFQQHRTEMESLSDFLHRLAKVRPSGQLGGTNSGDV